jgi:hypothetical protein
MTTLTLPASIVNFDFITDLADGPAPSWDAPRYEPSPISASFYLGFELGLAGETPAEPAEFPAEPAEGPTNRAFLAGLVAGRYRLERERDADLERHIFEVERMEAAFADPYDLVSDNELIECRGYHPSMAYDA